MKIFAKNMHKLLSKVSFTLHRTITFSSFRYCWQ